LHLSFIPHWNNAEGGLDLDTSRCFIGMERFAQWCDLVPSENTTLGLDEHTGLIIDFEKCECEVSGVSSVSLVRECNPDIFASGAKFPLSELGQFAVPDPLENGIRPEVWEMVTGAAATEEKPPAEVLDLLEQRKAARVRKDFAESDRLRDEISARGWQVQDTKEGQQLGKM